MPQDNQQSQNRKDRIERLLEGLPPRPGVYLMKDSAGRVIYVGKAVSLRSRVRSYFRESGDTRFSIQHLRSRIDDIETVATDTEKEALLLENLLIKKYQPRYNIRLRDDKTYISLRLDTTHEWPRLHRVRKRRTGDKAEYFGPFSSSAAVKETMRFLQKMFPLRSCPDHVLRNRMRPCILHQIDRCSAPCVDKVEKEKYDEYVKQTILFLRGRKEEVVDLLRKKMWQYSESMEYEKAAEIRDRISAIEETIEKELVASHREFDRDVIGLARGQGLIVVMILQFRGGNLGGTKSYSFKDHGLADEEVLESFVSQYYEEAREIPREIVLSSAPMNRELLAQILVERRAGAVDLTIPQRAEKRRLAEMALENARMELEKRLAGEQSRERVLADLQKKLKLPELPRLIECFDISNFQGAFNVGSMTSFVDGEPDKSRYRHFKIRSVEGQNDFESLREILMRRYKRVIEEARVLPDLIVIDGGKGQLNIAIEVMKELGIHGRVPVCGLAKARLKSGRGEKVRTQERVFLPGRKNPVVFDQSDPALFILTRLRDEAHRFGITYHRKLRSTANLRSGLEEIPGVGPKRRKNLLIHFGSLARIKEASLAELAAAPGITESLAQGIHLFFHGLKQPDLFEDQNGEEEESYIEDVAEAEREES